VHPSRRSNDERTRERADRERTDRERGSASLEFITLGVLLLVPLVYLVLALAAVQAGAFAAEGAARYGARVAVLARHDGSAPAAAERAVGLAFDDFGLTGATARTTVTCHPAGRCTDAGARVRVEVTASVPLPFVPDVFGLRVGAVGVEGVATQTVSKYAGVTR
jgi:hypothetical protein